MGTGGSRFGAGRPAWHVTAEHCLRLDARRWARERILQSACSGGWQWTNGETGEVTASIGYRSEPGAVTLDYAMNGTHTQQRLRILTTDCTYGGRRYWFACPFCNGRVACLYLRTGRGFGCRKCGRIVYASQSEDACGRAWRKQAKVERRLGDDWGRPKGMHLRTHERLLQVIVECEERREAALAPMLARLGWPGPLEPTS